MINDFDFIQPQDLTEALRALSNDSRILPLAGGTNVLVNMKRGPLDVDQILDITRLETLQSISTQGDTLRLGAGVTFDRLLEWRPGGAIEALIRPMCLGFAGPLVRNLATIGGNICDASPAADVSPVLLALDATVELESAADGSRRLPLPAFFQGVRKTARRDHELLTSVIFDKPGDDTRAFYYKLGKRKADAISIVSIAIAIQLKQGKVDQARIALGAVAPVAMRALKAEEIIQGETLADNTISAAAEAAAAEAQPIDDFRARAEYRRQMVEVLVKRGLDDIARSQQD